MTVYLFYMVQATGIGPPKHALDGQWVHESELPLWLIKAYEEKSRREAAVQAARAAREAARQAARGTASSYINLEATNPAPT